MWRQRGRMEDMNMVADMGGGQEREGLTTTPVGRRRFLTLLGGALFGVATRAVAPKSSLAAPTPPLCNGAPGCDSCDFGGRCTECYRGPAYTCGGNQCWLVATAADASGCRKYYHCCDWQRSDESTCICRSYAYTSCSGAPSGGDGIRVPGGTAPSPSPTPNPPPSPSPAPPDRRNRGGAGGSPPPTTPPPTDGGRRSIRQ